MHTRSVLRLLGLFRKLQHKTLLVKPKNPLEMIHLSGTELLLLPLYFTMQQNLDLLEIAQSLYARTKPGAPVIPVVHLIEDTESVEVEADRPDLILRGISV